MRRQNGSFGKTIRRWLAWLLLLAGLGWFGYQFFLYVQARRFLPAGMEIANLDVSGLTLEEAGELIRDTYATPVAIYHQEERVELDPQEVNFTVNVDAMLAEAEKYRTEQNFWEGYWFHLIGWTWEPMTVSLQASHDSAAVREMVDVIAGFLDEPAAPPQMLADTAEFETGRDGFVTDVDASVPKVEAALYRPTGREAHLVIEPEEAPELDFELLEAVIQSKLQEFDGIGSIFIMDLQTGEEIRINSDLALSGLSILKIAIFVEAYRTLELPLNDYQEGLFLDTATASSNYAANLLLHVVAGEDNTYQGADILTESMHNLGLVNTFMAVPYDAIPPDYRRTTYVTPANSNPDLPTDPDPTRQTTAEEMGTLLSMIYHCAQNGGGALMAVYPDQFTPEECRAIIDLMALNEEGNLIRFGVPEDVMVSHKHGWIADMHGDAGIVFSPGGDYVLVEYLHRPGGWLVADESFPILREISRAVYNYFNFDDPYLGNALTEESRVEPTENDAQNVAPDEAVDGEGGGEGIPAGTPTPVPEGGTEPATNQ